jgi:transcriptional regulator with XRE-family HTH domain
MLRAILHLDEKIVRQIKFQRKLLGIDQIDLAKTVGLSRTSISNIERSKQSLSLELFCKISYALNTTPDSLLRTVLSDQELSVQHTDVEDEEVRDIINSAIKEKYND